MTVNETTSSSEPDDRSDTPDPSTDAESAAVPRDQEAREVDQEEGVQNPPSSPRPARELADRLATESEVVAVVADVQPDAPDERVAPPEPELPPEPEIVTESDVAAAVARTASDPTSLAEPAGLQPEIATAAPEPVVEAPVGDPVPVLVPSFFIDRPEPPVMKSNRGVGILIALVGTAAFAVIWVGIVAAMGLIVTPEASYLSTLKTFFTQQVMGATPVVVFFIAMIILIQIVNRGRWWGYILGGLGVGIVVYAAMIGAILVDVRFWNLTASARETLLNHSWTNAFAILAGVLGREMAVWTGAWLAARGRRLKVLNSAAQEAYEQELIESQNKAANAYTQQAV